MYQIAKKLNTVASIRTAYTYISLYTSSQSNIEKSIYDIIEGHIPHHHYLNFYPNQEFTNHYVVSDLMQGTLSSDLERCAF